MAANHPLRVRDHAGIAVAIALALLAVAASASGQMDFAPRTPAPSASLDTLAQDSNLMDPRADILGNGASGIPSFTSAAWQSELVMALVGLVERSARATIEAYGVEQARTLLCKGEGARLLPVSCSLLNAIDPYVTRVPWSAASGAFRSDLRRLPVQVVRQRFSENRAVPGAVTVAALAHAIVLLERGDDLPAILEGVRFAMEGGGSDPRLAKLDSIILAWLCVAVPVTRPTQLSEDVWRQSVAILYKTVWNEQASPATIDALWSLKVAASDIERLAGRAESARRAALQDGDHDAYATAFNTYVSAAIGLLNHVPRTIPPGVADSTFEGTFYAMTRSIQAVDRAMGGVRAGAYSVALAEILAAISALQADELSQDLVRFASFGAALAEARTADEMGGVLAGLATPPGGFRTKRRSSMLGVNAYLGGQWGRECGELEDCGKWPDHAAYGAFLPIGLESSWPIGCDFSIGVFASLLDLGQLLTVRGDSAVVEDSSAVVESGARIGFRQVMSPGLYVTVGLGKLPATFGAGASIAPHLRSVESAETSEGMSVVRTLLFLAIDVPLFRFR